jgi:class 3 adenylate cyclase
MIDRITRMFSAGRSHDVPRTYFAELDRQCERLSLFASLTAVVVWLPYIETDMALHSDQPAIVALRLGFSVVGVLMLLAHLLPKFEGRAVGLIIIFGAYLEIATGIITGLSGGDPAYVGGYIAVLLIAPLGPAPRVFGWVIPAISLCAFAAAAVWVGASFDTPRGRYSLNDLVVMSVVSAAFVYFMDKLRRRSWDNLVEVRRHEAELEESNRLAEAARLDAEKARGDSDRLLARILPAAVAQELKVRGQVEPLFFDSVTVLFTDFVGFTQASEQMLPDELVAELDGCFSQFDEVAARNGLEKLKTIGDAYMCAGGLPQVRTTHALDACLAALELRSFMAQTEEIKRLAGFDSWQIRIGIHSGPVTAGVIGTNKFAYDIWGDTVNTASRMESSSEPGMINISGDTYNLVKEFFDCEYRGKVQAKGKGEIDMHFLLRIKPELSADTAGLIPNGVFEIKRLDREQGF